MDAARQPSPQQEQTRQLEPQNHALGCASPVSHERYYGIAGVRSSADAADDSSLLSLGEGSERYVRSSTCPRGRTAVEQSRRPSVWLSSLTGKQCKLVEDHLNGRTMLFDLLENPPELRNLSQEQTETPDLLRQALAARDATLLGMDGAGPAPGISEAEARRLESLGYL